MDSKWFQRTVNDFKWTLVILQQNKGKKAGDTFCEIIIVFSFLVF